MKNTEFKFKTTLDCGGCVSKVKPDLDNAKGISYWNVDITHADKILTVGSKGITEEEIISLIAGKGFLAEPIAD